MIKVLTLDGCQRSALAATRSLGRRGLAAYTADTVSPTLAGSSRHARGQLVYPDPRTRPGAFVDWVVSTCASQGFAAVLPLTDLTTMLLAPVAARLAPARLLAADAAAYQLVSDKGRLIDLARRAGVRVPATAEVRSMAELDAHLADCAFPLVMKPSQSKVFDGRQVHETGVFVARDAQQARAWLRAQAWLPFGSCLLQQFIPGHGAGVFACYSQGKPLAWFCHRRLREKPPSGGVSVLSESIAVDPELKANAARILDAANWNGVAMVEFRVDRAGDAWLMEVNGRLWGSLQLAIDSGVDFPWLLWEAVAGNGGTPVTAYSTGRRLRWLFGDLDNLIIQLRDGDRPWSSRLRACASFLATFASIRTRQEVFRWSDTGPARHELASWFRALA